MKEIEGSYTKYSNIHINLSQQHSADLFSVVGKAKIRLIECISQFFEVFMR